MAVVAETVVANASRADVGRLDELVGVAMTEAGGPPPGLMAHYIRPTADGFLICEVWRGESEMRAFYDDVLLPLVAEAGLTAGTVTTAEVWSFARP